MKSTFKAWYLFNQSKIKDPTMDVCCGRCAGRYLHVLLEEIAEQDWNMNCAVCGKNFGEDITNGKRNPFFELLNK